MIRGTLETLNVIHFCSMRNTHTFDYGYRQSKTSMVTGKAKEGLHLCSLRLLVCLKCHDCELQFCAVQQTRDHDISRSCSHQNGLGLPKPLVRQFSSKHWQGKRYVPDRVTAVLHLQSKQKHAACTYYSNTVTTNRNTRYIFSRSVMTHCIGLLMKFSPFKNE